MFLLLLAKLIGGWKCGKQLQMTEKYSTNDLPGFQSCCIDKGVLKRAAIGLRNRKNKRYTSMYEQCQTANSQNESVV